MSAPAVSIEVSKRFHDLRGRYRTFRMAIVLAIAVIVVLSLWLSLTAIDYCYELSLLWRAVCAGCIAAVVAAWGIYQIARISRDAKQKPFASLLEHSLPDFGQRIRTVLDTVAGRVGGPVGMLSALGNQTLGRWETLTPSELLPTTVLVRLVCILVAIASLAVGVYGVGGDWRIAMLRSLGQDIGYTSLRVDPGNTKVWEDSPVEVSLELSGRVDRDVSLRHRIIKESEGEWMESETLLSSAPGNGSRLARFTAGLGNATDAIEYQFRTTIGDTNVFRIDVQPRIEALSVLTVVDSPPYTQLPQREFTSEDITVLQHSDVRVTIETSHPLKTADIEFGAKASELASMDTLVSESPTRWSFALPSEQTSHWQFSGAAKDGTPMTPLQGRLRIRLDEAPKITWREPVEPLCVHGLAEVPMCAVVTDDFGVTESGILFRIGIGDEFVLMEWKPENTPKASETNETRVRLEEVLPLESFALSEREFVAYYSYAIDNRGSAPQRIESDMRYIDIRPYRQRYFTCDCKGNCLCVGLEEIIRRQRVIINRTRGMIQNTEAGKPPRAESVDQLANSQNELAGVTQYLAEAAGCLGPEVVETLQRAAATMVVASDFLSTATFESALTLEESALTTLVEARRLVFNSVSKNPKAAQQFTLPIRQKLRLDRKVTEQEAIDQLRKIAAAQSQLGSMAASQAQQSSQNASGKAAGSKTSKSNASAQSGSNAGASGANGSGRNGVGTNGSGENGKSSDGKSGDGKNGSGENSQSGESGKGGLKGGQADEGTESGNSNSSNDSPFDFFAKQVDLLEQLRAVEEALKDRLSQSPLLESRMQEAKRSMDELAALAKDNELQKIAKPGEETADQLREMAAQLDALAVSEAIARISEIQKIVNSLAKLENALGTAQCQQNGGSQSGTPGGGISGSAGGGTSGDPSPIGIATRLGRRSETLADVLKAPPASFSFQPSQVDDHLQRFADETSMMTQLQATQKAAKQIGSKPGNGQDRTGEKAKQRGMEYAKAAERLGELYQRLAAPRLASLRRLEATASKLNSQLSKSTPNRQETLAHRAEAERLRQELDNQGLSDLATLLKTSGDLRGAKPGDGGPDSRSNGLFKGQGPAEMNLYAKEHLRLAERSGEVVKELRKQIQELVLLEIATDRNTPVPAQYRNAVDRYFSAIAGDDGINQGSQQ